jgi:hypothetical protein
MMMMMIIIIIIIIKVVVVVTMCLDCMISQNSLLSVVIHYDSTLRDIPTCGKHMPCTLQSMHIIDVGRNA